MKRLILLLACLLPVLAWGQYLGGGLAAKGAAVIPVAAAAPPAGESLLPTNIVDVTALAGWSADYCETNASGQASNVFNLVVGSPVGNLTNYTGITKCPYTTNVLNGHRVFTFDGSDDILRCDTMPGGMACSFAILANVGFSGTGLWRALSYGTAYWFARKATTFYAYMFSQTASSIGDIFPTNQWRFYAGTINAETHIALYTNNGTAYTLGVGTAPTAKFSTMGRYTDAVEGFPAHYAEIWIFTNALSAANVSNVFWYMTNRYGVQVQ